MKRTAGAAVLLVGLLACTAARAVDIVDCCDWASGWTFSSFDISAGTASATVEPSGGNPGARLNVTTVTPGPSDTAFGTALLTTSTMPAPLSGSPFTLHIDALSGPGDFGQGQGIELLAAQGGSVYADALGITGFPLSSFTTLAFSGTFTAGAFTKISGAGPATPSFDGTTPTQFGFAAGNNKSATLTQFYDNFRLTVVAPEAATAQLVPTLSYWSLAALACAIAVLALFRRRATHG